MVILSAAWAFLRSPLGRQVALWGSLVVLLLGFGQWRYHDGEVHERMASRKALAAVEGRLDVCHANEAKLAGVIADKNAALDALGRKSAEALKASEADIAKVNKGRARAEARSQMLVDRLDTLKPGTACERTAAAAAAVREALK